MNEEEKLDHGQRHVLSLIKRDADSQGWAIVSKTVMPAIEGMMPKELIEVDKYQEGNGRARLTVEGKEVVNAMKWL